ncbi:unnamed protein product [Calypogeia fissa]
MATAPPALPRRGHAFEGGGGGRSSQGFGSTSSSHVGAAAAGGVGGGAIEIRKQSSSDANWKKKQDLKHDLFDDFDEDEDENPLSIVRSGSGLGSGRKGEVPSSTTSGTNTGSSAVARAPSPTTIVKGAASSIGVGSGVGAMKEAGGVEKKRGLGADGGGKSVAESSGAGAGGACSPVTKKVKMGGSAVDAMEPSKKREPNRDEDDEDEVPLATRMSKMVPPGTTNNTPDSMRSKVAIAKKIMEDRKKAKTEVGGGLASMANLSSTGTNGAVALAAPAKGGVFRASPEEEKEGPGRIANHSSSHRDEKKPDFILAGKTPPKPLPKPASKPAVERNWVPDSDDSDDDKPLSHRKSMSLTLGRDSKQDNAKLKEALSKKRPAGPVVVSPKNQSAVKKLKIVPSGQKSSSIQSPKSGSLHSPRATVKRESDSSTKAAGRRADPNDDDDDDVPLAQRLTSLAGSAKSNNIVKKPVAGPGKSLSKAERDQDDDDDNVPLAKRMGQAPVAKAATKATTKVVATIKKPSASSAKSITKKVLEQRRKGKSTVKTTKQVVKTKISKTETKMIVSGGTQKWETLEHSGVIFPPPYQPHGVKMLYKGKPVTLAPEQEEVATMFAVMKDTDYATKPKFIENFWGDWQPILGKKHVIQDFEGCDFTPIYDWHMAEKEKKKNMSSEEKKKFREEKLRAEDKYMWALVNGVKEKVGNFRVEPPGLFRGRGEHPKMGKLKKRIFPENIVINIGKGAPIPECPMPGHKWKEIRHDNTVTWLAFWNDPINSKEFKYVFLAASSSLKGQSDMEKYEKARMLKDHIENIRRTYTRNFNSSDPATRQIAVATYLIDRLALRAGNEKDEDEADTVGCCSLKVEHVILVPPSSLTFDFLGKDSIRYFNTVEVEHKVYSAIGDFKKGKRTGMDLFDKLDTSKLNQHLKGIMPALTAKVFRTYNASITLDTLLQDTVGSNVIEKVADYQRANKEVAILCNHQRTVSKSHSSQMEKLEAKMTEAEDLIRELKVDLDRARKGKPPLKDSEGKPKKNLSAESLEKKIAQAEQRVEKMKLDMRIKDDLKTVALGTSKINYMDPRISVAWCKRHEVPIEKVFNKSLLAKFAWAMDVEPDYRF